MSLSKSCLPNLLKQIGPPEEFHYYILSLSCICLFSSFCTLLSPSLLLCLSCLSCLLTPTLQDEEKAALPASKKPGKGRPLLSREKSADSSSTSSSASAEKQRQEARKRLLAAKKAASFRQNSATESADSIEIYVPEAQTRLWERQWERKDIGSDQRTVKCHWNTWKQVEENFCNANELHWVQTDGGGGEEIKILKIRVGGRFWAFLTNSYCYRLVLVESNTYLTIQKI